MSPVFEYWPGEVRASRDKVIPGNRGAAAIQRHRSGDLVVLGALVLVGIAIRSQHLTSPFFYDEAVYVNLAQHPFHSDFYPDPVFFRHPPAHHLLLAAWGRMVGYGEIAMRLPSLLFGAATIVLTYLLGLRVLAQRAALAAAALLTFGVLHQQYAQAATMYAMATFFVTLCVYGLVSGDERLVAGGFLGAIYTHYFGFYLAPSVLLFDVRRYDGSWKRIAARVALYVAAYSPWIAVGLEGLAFHSNRGHELLGWDFHWLNLLRQLSAALLAGSLCLLFVERRRRDLQPALLLCAVFLLSAPLLAPFQRYLVPFLPTLIVLGVAGLVWLFQSAARRFQIRSRIGRAALLALLLIGVSLPNVEAYGVYPAMGRYLDLRDAIQLQEWERVIAAVPDGRVATANARSLIFYGNLKGVRAYEVVEQFDDNPTKFARLVERGLNDWIVLSKYPPYAALIPIAARSTRYRRVAEFDSTVVYEKVDR
jgi:4-amino-4-deoxy-L-arabinose transferase-like glycosyltransferase